MPPRCGDPRSYWSETPLSWEDMRRIIASGELDVRAPVRARLAGLQC
jgi:hypothetical protein